MPTPTRFETIPYTWYIRFNADGSSGMFYERQTIVYDETDKQISGMRTEERLTIAYTPQEVEEIAGAVTVETAKRLEAALAENETLKASLEEANDTVGSLNAQLQIDAKALESFAAQILTLQAQLQTANNPSLAPTAAPEPEPELPLGDTPPAWPG